MRICMQPYTFYHETFAENLYFANLSIPLEDLQISLQPRTLEVRVSELNAIIKST